MSERPLFVAQPPPDEFWRQYRVYLDRVELETILGVMTIPFDDIEQVEESTRPKTAAKGESLVIGRRHGWVRWVCIRSREADGFRQALETALCRHRCTPPDH